MESLADKITPRQRSLIMIVAFSATAMMSLDMSIANVALPEIQGGLAISAEQVSWVLTSYLVASAIGMPLVGALAAPVGLRRLYVICFASFGVTSLACGLSTSLAELVAFRALQGMAGAALMPLGQMLLYDIYPREKIAKALGLYNVGALSGIIIGPSLGGFITDTWSWPWLFFVNVPVSIFGVIGMLTLLPRVPKVKSPPFDYVGFGLLATALCALQLMLDRGQSEDWFDSTEIITEAIVAGLAFYLFFVHMKTARHPFMDAALFRDRNFVVGTFVYAVTAVASFVPSAITPMFLQNVQGYSVFETGLVLTPRGIAMVATMYFLGRIADHVDKRLLVGIGLAATVVGYVGMSRLSTQSPAFDLVWTTTLLASAMAFLILPLNLVAFSTLDSKLRPMGASTFQLCRSVGTSIGTAIALSFVAANTEINHVRLLEGISPYNVAMDALPRAFSLSDPVALKLLSLEVWRQATVIAYDNLFTLTALLVLFTIPLVLLIRPAKRAAEDKRELLEPVHA